ncbi:alpha/beta hydrolase, partial [Aquipuribacter hungaricus]
PPRPGLLRGPALRALGAAQLPSLPEHVLLHRGGVRRYLDDARATPAPAADVDYYVASVRVPSVAHTSLEPWRWLARASLRPDGVRWWRSVRGDVAVPVLRVDGGEDRFAVGRAVDRTGPGAGAVPAPDGQQRVVLPGVGHLVPEEAPEQLLEALLAWLPGVVRPG